MRKPRKFPRPEDAPHVVPAQLRTLDRVLAEAVHNPERERADLAAIRAALAETSSPAPLPADDASRPHRTVVPISSHPRHRPAPVGPVPVAAPSPSTGLGHVDRFRAAASRVFGAGLVLRATSRQADVLRYAAAAAFVVLAGVLLIFSARVLVSGRFGPSVAGPSAMMPPHGAATPPATPGPTGGRTPPVTPRPTGAVAAPPPPGVAAPATRPRSTTQPKPRSRKAEPVRTPNAPVAPEVPPPPFAPRPTPTPPPTPAHAITINATAVDYTGLRLHDVGVLDRGRVQTLNLRAGAYTLETPVGWLIDFGVSDSGRVDYEPGLDGVLTGRDGDSLTITGFPIVVDTSETDYHNTMVSGTGWRTPEPVRTLRLLPGRHWVESPMGNRVRFDLTDQGRIDYPTELDTLLSGRDTAALTVHGFPVTIDASRADQPIFLLLGVGWRDARLPQLVRLLPDQSGVMTLDETRFEFRVDGNGLIDYDPSLDCALFGRGSSALTIYGWTRGRSCTGT
ncbi:MAG: hypothetical protein ACJ72N_23870 [Labedaea sp.]